MIGHAPEQFRQTQIAHAREILALLAEADRVLYLNYRTALTVASRGTLRSTHVHTCGMFLPPVLDYYKHNMADEHAFELISPPSDLTSVDAG
jgi:hypothetical protein